MTGIRRRKRRGYVAVILAGGLVVGGLVGCASGPEKRERSEPEAVMGQPPGEDDEDYEFAPPPRHPGEHGDVGQQRVREDHSERESDAVYRSEIEELQEYGPSVILEHVDTEPLHEGGAFVGFQIVDVSERAHSIIWPHLRVGDVITHVNLVRLERPDDYLEAWNTLEEVQEVRIDFVRDGESNQAIWRVQ